jgi:glycosyltransferase involved in cell wall biosynthesis
MNRLLYLGFAFPPGVSALFPEMQPAGHLIETSLVGSLRPWFEIRSVGIASIRVAELSPGASSPGLPHALNLLDQPPELYHRWNSLRRLKQTYADWVRQGWRPDAILVCNFSPVFNSFVRWLKRRPPAPSLVLYLADSMTLGQIVPWGKRLRHKFKPLACPDSQMAQEFDACVAVSRATETFFKSRHLPWLWLPNGCDARRAIQQGTDSPDGPISFGYFGALAPHTGLPALLKVFSSKERGNLLHICGFGPAKARIESLCRGHPQLRFHGPRTPDQCLQWAQLCDVLVNPRPIMAGNDNNFSSKVFEYALSGRAILSSRLSGVDAVLGEEAFYFEADDFARSLDEALGRIGLMPRAELRRRGRAIQARLTAEYSWPRQGARLAEFIRRCLAGQRGG